ncbi:TPA: efflux RND transporter permease subunit, partial [Candidatus Poribacteria bacterium]|nr:efflux RND transporter permease subunit [Candidatus Poribacteria bacterium]
MRLPKLAIENYQFTLVVIILLVLSGIVSFFTMPRSEDPQVAVPGASVIVIYPGANPTDMEQLVVDPIEASINELDDIKRIDSSMEDGLAIVGVEFLSGTDPDEKYSDVVQQVNSIRNDLPTDIMSLDMRKWTVSNVNILQVAIVSDSTSYKELEKEAERLEKRLERVSGVKRVKTLAFPEQEVRVAVNLEKMSQMRISLNQVFSAIQSANMNIPGGNIDIGAKRFNIQTSGNYKSHEDIGNTIVHSTGTAIVYLKDIADIYFDYEDSNYYARFNGKRAVFVTANQKEHTNIFDIMDDLKIQIAEFEQRLPKSMTLHYVFDQSESVATRMNNFFSNLLQGMVLVGIVILLSLSVRSSIIVMLAIPISILIGIGFVDLSGYGLEQISIAGLVIVLGILVDNAIVVTENVSRFLKMGYGNKDAAVEGTSQIGWAIVSSTVTTVLAFIPIMMMRDITGDFIRSLPVTVVYTLTASLFIALTLTPYLSNKFLIEIPLAPFTKGGIKAEKAKRENKIQRFLNYLIQSPYRKILGYALYHSKLAIAIAMMLFLISLALFPLVGVSFFPKAEKPQFFINIETPEGTSLDKTDEVAKYVESTLSSREEIKHYATNVGRGNPQVYYNVGSKRGITHAQIFIELKRRDLKIMSNLIDELREKFDAYTGARIEVKELEQGPPVEAPIAIKVLGDNLDVLRDISHDVEKIISSTPGAINIDNPLSASKTDLRVNIDREKAGMLGVPLADIDRTIRACIAGMTVSKYRDSEGKEYNIVVRLPIDRKPSLSDFDKIYVTSVIGAQIPLKQVASVEFGSSPQEITHYNLGRSVTITADVLSDYSVDRVTGEIISKLDGYNWPKSYRYYVGGELEAREESFGGMGRAAVIAVIAIFAVLVLQFRSFTQPLIVFAAIPLAIIGSIIALLITGYTFSFTAFVGLTSLVGIVVNNSIILVDYTNKLRREGKDLISALKEAGETRFRPIIFTTATTIGGLLPITLRGGTLWAPMGWTIIGGLMASTFLTLIIVPV